MSFKDHEQRLMTITTIGIETKALIFDERTHEVRSSDDPITEKLFYARAFQAWADGKVEGTADEIFDAIQEALEV